MRAWYCGVSIVLSFAILGCGKRRPGYCDEDEPCESGVCDEETSTCVPGSDARPIDGPLPPDANLTCAMAGGRIVFVSDRNGGDTEIVTMYADGTDVRVLTDNTWPDATPRIGPDGATISWVTTPAGQPQLYVMNIDGSDQRDLLVGPLATNTVPVWSGDRLAFSSNRDGNPEVYTVRVDGSDLRNLSMDDGWDVAPAWSPDGARLAFATDRNDTQTITGIHRNDLYVMDADGTDQVLVDDESPEYHSVEWSPSGQRFGFRTRFVSGTGSIEAALKTIEPAGSNIRTVVADGAGEFAWSHDGTTLLFEADGDLFSSTPTGTNLANLTNSGAGAANESPRWSPDGMKIVFASDRDDNEEIYVMGRDGAEPTNLTNEPSADTAPAWGRCP